MTCITESLEFIGQGCDRDVFLDKERGVVHKTGDIDANRIEIENISCSKSRRFPEWFAIPEWCKEEECDTCKEGSHITMPYIKGTLLVDLFPKNEYGFPILPPDIIDKIDKIRDFGFEDIHDENIIVEESGRWVLIDLGHY